MCPTRKGWVSHLLWGEAAGADSGEGMCGAGSGGGVLEKETCKWEEGGWWEEVQEGVRRKRWQGVRVGTPFRDSTLTRGTGWSGWSAAPRPAA